MVAPIFGPNAQFCETTLDQAIYHFDSTSAVNVSSIEPTPNSRRNLPYLLPSDILGRSLNFPSSSIPMNAPSAPIVARLITPIRVPRSIQNPFPNSQMGGTSMPPIALSNAGSHFYPLHPKHI